MKISLKLAPAIKARWQRRDGPLGDGVRSVAHASGAEVAAAAQAAEAQWKQSVKWEFKKANAKLKVTVQRRRCRMQQDP